MGSKSRCQPASWRLNPLPRTWQWPTGHRPWLPHGIHAPGLGRVAAGHALKRPLSVLAPTHALILFVSLALALAERKSQCHRRRHSSIELANCRHHAIVQ